MIVSAMACHGQAHGSALSKNEVAAMTASAKKLSADDLAQLKKGIDECWDTDMNKQNIFYGGRLKKFITQNPALIERAFATAEGERYIVSRLKEVPANILVEAGL